MPIDVKEAICKAKEYAGEIFESKSGVSLEEVWFDERAGEWSVTVGIRHQKIGAPEFALSVFNTEIIRSVPEYKVVRLNGETGEPVAIHNYDRVAAE